MSRTILVPLDGSAQGEQALPLAVSIARAAKAELKLVHVIPPGNDSAHPVPPTSQHYLDLVTWRLKQMDGLTVVTCALLHGPVAETLAECAAGMAADLIVMTTHGRGPISRFWLGSVADRLMRRSTVPLLLLRPAEGQNPSEAALGHGFRRVLIALDGTSASEAAVAPAIALGNLFGATYALLRVVEPMPIVVGDGMTAMPSAYDAQLFEEVVKQADANLAEVAGRMREGGLMVATHKVIGDSPARAILEAAKAADLTVLATHGRGGAARFFLGSVADKVIRGSESPVLLVRYKEP